MIDCCDRAEGFISSARSARSDAPVWPLDTVDDVFVAGVVAAVLGIALFHVALGKTLRANAADRIPVVGGPKASPRGSVAMRAIGAGLILLGAGFMSTGGVHWAVMVLLAGPVAALIVIGLHNRRVNRSQA